MQFDSLKLSRLAFAVVNHAAHVSRGDDGKKNEPQMSSRLVDFSLEDTMLPLFRFLCLLFSSVSSDLSSVDSSSGACVCLHA